MGRIYRFLAIDNEIDVPLDWLLRQPDSPEVIEKPNGLLLYFRSMGPLIQEPNGSAIDVLRSPIVSLFRPVTRRGALWSSGEVHFLPMSRLFPSLQALSRRFGEWLTQFELVFSGDPSWSGEWNYYLEGSLRNYDTPIFALPMAMQALRGGQYFVSRFDHDGVLDPLCRSLRHRGVNCISDS